MQTLSPVAVIHTPAGETVLDMGQNMVGWLEFTCRAPKGSEFYLQFGEVLQDGNFYRDNMRTALCEYHYVSDGKPKAVRPTFTFYGFRYVKLTKWPQDVALSDFRGLVLYTTLPATGSLLTANEKAVSYTHLDVYKRQDLGKAVAGKAQQLFGLFHPLQLDIIHNRNAHFLFKDM